MGAVSEYFSTNFIQKVMQGKCSYTVFLCIQNLHPKSYCTGAFELLPLGMLSECCSSSRRSSSSKLGASWLFTSWPWISDLLL